MVVEVPGQMLTGFAEEGLFRGLMLAALLAAWSHRRRGVLGAVVVSSVFFAVLRLLNLLDGAGLRESVAQVFYAFNVGLAFAALCIRTGTIWLAVVVHGLVDVTGIAFTDPDPAADGPTGLVLGVLVPQVRPDDGRPHALVPVDEDCRAGREVDPRRRGQRELHGCRHQDRRLLPVAQITPPPCPHTAPGASLLRFGSHRVARRE